MAQPRAGNVTRKGPDQHCRESASAFLILPTAPHCRRRKNRISELLSPAGKATGVRALAQAHGKWVAARHPREALKAVTLIRSEAEAEVERLIALLDSLYVDPYTLGIAERCAATAGR
jgi:hypothetical protein